MHKLLSKVLSLKNLEQNQFPTMKENDFSKINGTIEELCRSMEIIKNLKFLNLKIIDVAETQKLKRKIRVQYSLVYKVKCNFEFLDEETGELLPLSFSVIVPKLVNGNYFYINGVEYEGVLFLNNYLPIFMEKEKEKNIIIKTMINNFTIILKEKNKRLAQSFVTIFTKKVNLAIFLLVLYANEDKKEIFNEIYGIDNWYEKELEDDDNREYCIVIGDKCICPRVLRPYMPYIAMSFNFLKLNEEKMNNNEYLLRRLGSFFSSNTNTYLEKGTIVKKTIERSLDDTTKRLLKTTSMFELFMREIKQSWSVDQGDFNSVDQKKIKFSELILFPLFKRISDNVYIYLNSRKKNINNTFKIAENIIIQHVTTSEVLQYNDSSSAFHAFKNYKVFYKNIDAGKHVSTNLRNVHKSMIGFADIFSSPLGDSTGLSSFVNTLRSKTIINSTNNTVKVLK